MSSEKRSASSTVSGEAIRHSGNRRRGLAADTAQCPPATDGGQISDGLRKAGGEAGSRSSSNTREYRIAQQRECDNNVTFNQQPNTISSSFVTTILAEASAIDLSQSLDTKTSGAGVAAQSSLTWSLPKRERLSLLPKIPHEVTERGSPYRSNHDTSYGQTSSVLQQQHTVHPVDGQAAATTGSVFCLPQPKARRSSFACNRISLRLNPVPWTELPSGAATSDTKAELSFEERLKAHARVCMQQAVSKVADSVSGVIEGLQQFLVKAGEASDHAIECIAADTQASQNAIDRSEPQQPPAEHGDFFHELNAMMSRECHQWESLLQTHRANADRSQAQLTALAVQTTGCRPPVVDPQRTGCFLNTAELCDALQNYRLQAVLASQSLVRATSIVRRLEQVASKQATDEVEQLAAMAIPETPRQPLLRVLGRR